MIGNKSERKIPRKAENGGSGDGRGKKRTVSPKKRLGFSAFAFSNVLHKSEAKSSCLASRNKEFLNTIFSCLYNLKSKASNDREMKIQFL